MKFLLLLIFASAAAAAVCPGVLLWGLHAKGVDPAANPVGEYMLETASMVNGKPLYKRVTSDPTAVPVLYISWSGAPLNAWVVSSDKGSSLDGTVESLGRSVAFAAEDVDTPDLVTGNWTFSGTVEPTLRVACNSVCAVAIFDYQTSAPEAEYLTPVIEDAYDFTQLEFSDGRPQYEPRNLNGHRLNNSYIYYDDQSYIIPYWFLGDHTGGWAALSVRKPSTKPTLETAGNINWRVYAPDGKTYDATAQIRCLQFTCFPVTCPPDWNTTYNRSAFRFDVPYYDTCDHSTGCTEKDCCIPPCSSMTDADCPAGQQLIANPSNNLCQAYPCTQQECCREKPSTTSCEGFDQCGTQDLVLIPNPQDTLCSQKQCEISECCQEKSKTCGNGIKEDWEDCDSAGSPCCTDVCTWATGKVCRPAVGICDVDEICGQALDCPEDIKKPKGTKCHDAAGPCGFEWFCDGVDGQCPASKTFRHSHHICRLQQDECDLPERCTGKDDACPADRWRKDGTPCGGPRRSHECIKGKCSKAKRRDPDEHTHRYDELEPDHSHAGPPFASGLGSYRAAYPKTIYGPDGEHYHP